MKHRVRLLPLLGGLLLVGCDRSGSADSGGESPASAATLTELPLKRGFYVTTDTACDKASNATLLLLHASGMNGARTVCDFESIEKTAPANYRAAAACKDIQYGETERTVYRYEISDNTQFSYRTEDSDYRSQYRYCEQSSLPDPWRDNDISDLIGGDARP